LRYKCFRHVKVQKSPANFFNHRERREDAEETEENLCELCEKLRDLCGFSLVFTAEALRRRGKAINAFFVSIRLIRVNSWILLTVRNYF
jgi:hypothetical protein